MHTKDKLKNLCVCVLHIHKTISFSQIFDSLKKQNDRCFDFVQMFFQFIIKMAFSTPFIDCNKYHNTFLIGMRILLINLDVIVKSGMIKQ